MSLGRRVICQVLVQVIFLDHFFLFFVRLRSNITGLYCLVFVLTPKNYKDSI